MSLMVPAMSHSFSHIPGVVGLWVVVVVVVVVVLDGEVSSSSGLVVLELAAAARAASNSFSIDIGVVEGVGQPVNSVVALLTGTSIIKYIKYFTYIFSNRASMESNTYS